MDKKKLIIILGGLGALTVVVVIVLRGMLGYQVSKSGYGDVGIGDWEVYGPVPAAEYKSSSGITGALESLGSPLSPDFIAQERRGRPIEPVPPLYPQPDDALEVDERVYRKTSRFGVVADDVSAYMQNVTAYVLSIDGRVLQSNMNANNKMAYGYLQVKVPVEKFEETNQKVVADAEKVMQQEVSAEDRTGTVVNIAEQIQELQDAKFELELELEQATTEVEQRRLEREIAQVDAQIERLNEQMQGVEATVEYAAVGVQVADSTKYFDPDGSSGSDDLGETIENAWEAVLGILFWIAKLLIWVVIFGILWLPFVLLVWLIAKLLKRDNTPKAE